MGTREWSICVVSADWHKSRVKAARGARTRGVKSRLGDGVIFLLEGEENRVSWLSIHRLGREHEARGAPHGYVELGSSHLDRGGGKESGKFENGGKMHVVETEGKGREKRNV